MTNINIHVRNKDARFSEEEVIALANISHAIERSIKARPTNLNELKGSFEYVLADNKSYYLRVYPQSGGSHIYASGFAILPTRRIWINMNVFRQDILRN